MNVDKDTLRAEVKTNPNTTIQKICDKLWYYSSSVHEHIKNQQSVKTKTINISEYNIDERASTYFEKHKK